MLRLKTLKELLNILTLKALALLKAKRGSYRVALSFLNEAEIRGDSV